MISEPVSASGTSQQTVAWKKVSGSRTGSETGAYQGFGGSVTDGDLDWGRARGWHKGNSSVQIYHRGIGRARSGDCGWENGQDERHKGKDSKLKVHSLGFCPNSTPSRSMDTSQKRSTDYGGSKRVNGIMQMGSKHHQEVVSHHESCLGIFFWRQTATITSKSALWLKATSCKANQIYHSCFLTLKKNPKFPKL